MASNVSYQFDPRRPTFTVSEMVYKGKTYGRNELFDWEPLGLIPFQVQNFFLARKLYHNSSLEVTFNIGDQLGEVTLEQLELMIDKMNEYVRDLTRGDKSEYNTRKMKKSVSKDMNRRVGLVRSWLRQFPKHRDKFYEIRDEVLSKGTPEVEPEVIVDDTAINEKPSGDVEIVTEVINLDGTVTEEIE